MAEWIPWSDYYDTGIPGIDEQHRELFRQFNLVCDAVWDGKDRGSIKGFLLFLANYAQEHFRNEEILMKRQSYPGYAAHKNLHDALVGDVSTFIQRYESETLASDVVVKVITDLGEWTRQHIRGKDQGLGRFLQGKEWPRCEEPAQLQVRTLLRKELIGLSHGGPVNLQGRW